MAECHSKDGITIAALLLSHHDHHRRPSAHFRLWTSSFARIISDALSCGGSSYRFQHELGEEPPKARSEESDPPTRRKSDKLSDLLSIAEAENEEETKRKVEAFETMEAAVRELQLDERRGDAARRVRLLTKDDPNARATFAMLGAIPALVGMMEDGGDHDGGKCLVDCLYALLNIGIGNDANKAAIVKAGAVHKMLRITESPGERTPAVAEAIVANFLGLSALDSNKPIIGSSGAIPFMVCFLKNSSGDSQAKIDAFKALYNLSLQSKNVAILLETDFIPFLMKNLGDMEISARILLILSNVVQTPGGRKAVSGCRDAFPILVDVLNWNDSPECQETVSYILMVMAHKSYGDRQAMIDAGIVSALLELTLLGSTLAQKRASRILECFRIDKGERASENCAGGMRLIVSAPISGPSSSFDDMENHEDMLSEENKAVKQLVQQSLQSNMSRIVKRANLPHEFAPSEHLNPLAVTSKSVPF